MESRPNDKPEGARAADQATSTPPAERQRRFRIVKLEERIAPGGGNGNGSNLSCGNGGSCKPHTCF